MEESAPLDPEVAEWQSVGVPRVAAQLLIQGRPRAATRAVTLSSSEPAVECFYFICHWRGAGVWAPGVNEPIKDDRRIPAWLTSVLAAERELGLGNLKAARRIASQGLVSAPGSVSLRKIQAQILIDLGEVPAAIAVIEQLGAEGVQSATILRAQAARVAGDVDLADDLLTRFLQTDPSSIAAHNEIAVLFCSIGDFCLSIEHIVVARGIENGVPLSSIRMLRRSLAGEPIVRWLLSVWLVLSSIPMIAVAKYGIPLAVVCEVVGDYLEPARRSARLMKATIVLAMLTRYCCDAVFLSAFHVLKRQQTKPHARIRTASAAFLWLAFVSAVVASACSFSDWAASIRMASFEILFALVALSSFFSGNALIAVSMALLLGFLYAVAVAGAAYFLIKDGDPRSLVAAGIGLLLTVLASRPIVTARRILFGGGADSLKRRGIPSIWIREAESPG